MDVSRSHDPFAPEESTSMDFPAQRYINAGASVDDLTQLEQRYNELPEDAKRSELDRLAGISDYDIAGELEQLRAGKNPPAAAAAPETGASAGQDASGADGAPQGLQGVVTPPAENASEANQAVVIDIDKDGNGWHELAGTAVSDVSDVAIVDGDGTVTVDPVPDSPADACINVTGATADSQVVVEYHVPDAGA